jgi:2-keto-4-pentenoate hydratase/2-oxohepta-3-ene-1,7-dioic acid hydratase in catechol pathway
LFDSFVIAVTHYAVVGLLRPGDRVEAEAEGVGRLEVRIA